MSFIGAVEKRPPRWEWVRHGNGWALMQDQYVQMPGDPLWYPVHGMNRISVPDDGFDSHGAELRQRIADMLNREDMVDWTALCAAMSDISESCWAAGWLSDCEYSLWGFVQRNDGLSADWGMGVVSAEELGELRRMSQAIGGWVAWDSDAKGERFVPMTEWLEMYRKHLEAFR